MPGGGGVSVNPSSGFWSRFAGQMPGMMNSMGQQFGDQSMRPMIQNAGAAYAARTPMQRKPIRQPVAQSQTQPQIVSTPQIPMMPQMSSGVPNNGAMGQPIDLGGLWGNFNRYQTNDPRIRF